MNKKEFERKFAQFQFKSGLTARLNLWRKLSKLLSNNVPIKKALESMLESRLRVSKKDTVATAITDWLVSTNNGVRFSVAIDGWVSDNEIMLLSAGEQSGSLRGALDSCVKLMLSGKKIKSAIVSGITYPAFLIMTAFGILLLFGYRVIPVFSANVGEDKWTGMAGIMVVVAHWVQNYLAFAAVVVVAIIAVFFWTLPRWAGKYRVIADRSVPWSIYRMIQGSAWMIALAAMIDAGMRIETALDEMQKRANPWLASRIASCLVGMRSGFTVGESLSNSGMEFPDREIIDDLVVYSALSGFDDALKKIGDEWLEDGVDRIKGVMAVLFSVFVVLDAGILAFMFSGMLAMQLQLTSLLRA